MNHRYLVMLSLVTLDAAVCFAQDNPLLVDGSGQSRKPSHGSEFNNDIVSLKEGVPEKYHFLYETSSATNLEQIRASLPFTEIRLARSLCLGHCPVYESFVRLDGTCLYHGIAWVDRKGEFKSQIPVKHFAELCWAIERLGIDRDKRLPDSLVHDTPHTIVRITNRDGTIVEISDYGNKTTVELSLFAALMDKKIDLLKWEPK